MLKKFFSIFNHPVAKVGSGIVLLLSGLLELSESALEEFLNWEIGVHHGIIVFASAKVVGSLGEIIEGHDKVVKAKTKV